MSRLCAYLLQNANTYKIELRTSLPTKSPLLALCWGPEQRILFAGLPSGEIHLYNVETGLVTGVLAGHTGAITGLCTIPRVDVLASTAFDGTLRLWDLYRMCERKQLSGGHRKAVCSLDYSDEYRLLVTASFDHDVCVWSPYADKLIYKMKGMRSILCG